MSRQLGQKGGTEAHSCTDCEHPFCGLPDVPSRIPEPLGVRLGPCPRETRVHGNLAGPGEQHGPTVSSSSTPLPAFRSHPFTPERTSCYLKSPPGCLPGSASGTTGQALGSTARPRSLGGRGRGPRRERQPGVTHKPLLILTLRPADAGWCRPIRQDRDVPGRPR